jgi:hypothetical protein
VSDRCSDISRERGESQTATAVTAQRWLLLEVPGGWPRDVGDDGALPKRAQEAVHAWLERTPGSRLQFIRRPGRTGSPLLVFVVRSEETRRDVRRFELPDVDALASIDLEDAEAGAAVEGSLVLVCGHGSRDRCCALKGTAVFGEVADHLGDEELWISSHQGGHRFAANVLVLPQGIQLGRVQAGEAADLVARARDAEIELARYRGRTSYVPAVQAAESAVREATGLRRLDDLRLVEVENGGVRFRSADREWRVAVEQVQGPAVPASCGAAPAPQRAFATRIL